MLTFHVSPLHSGKTSLISTLLRLLELDTGSVTIDGVDISTIPRQEVRLRLNTLPQEPFFLQASIRDNVDLLHLSDDESIIAALRSVNLWQMLEERGGLDEMISEELLSHGQRQLFCLARAIVKPSSIVIIDEATSRYGTGPTFEETLFLIPYLAWFATKYRLYQLASRNHITNGCIVSTRMKKK